jgi:hypothetical protein
MGRLATLWWTGAFFFLWCAAFLEGVPACAETGRRMTSKQLVRPARTAGN